MKNNPLKQDSSDCEAGRGVSSYDNEKLICIRSAFAFSPCQSLKFFILKHGGNRPPASEREVSLHASLLHLCLHIKEFNPGITKSVDLEWGKASRLLASLLTRFLRYSLSSSER